MQNCNRHCRQLLPRRKACEKGPRLELSWPPGCVSSFHGNRKLASENKVFRKKEEMGKKKLCVQDTHFD
jgi:hypothetical protein